jgi:eukaryotic-like serine/threonine-protein kinase
MNDPLDEAPLDEAFAAYLRSCDAGQLASREDFLAQFPELSDQLRELMDAADMLGRITTPGDDSAVNGDAETVDLHAPGDHDSAPAIEETLPMATRGAGNEGPTLPFDLGDYELLSVLGRGGMGVVYRANQKALNRTVAVKMIRSGILADDCEVRRFYTEAQAAARLRHPGIVAVHQFGRRAGHHFFSMEYIEGTDLQRAIRDAPLDPLQAARYVRDVARAIHHAHEIGVLHRDLKPANVLIDLDDQVHVTDFGLAKHLDADSSVTASGAAVGTPHYMAPEQAIGHSDRATRQSDVYALGAVLFACVTGRPPIVADSVMQTLIQVAHQPAPSMRSVRRDAPADLETIAAKCLEKKPAKRYSSAEALANDLDAYLEGRPIAARPRAPWLKAWHWLEGVPVIAALAGRRIHHPSLGHRRFQTAMISLLLATPLLLIAISIGWMRHREAMPDRVRIGGGMNGGAYEGVAETLATALMSRFPLTAEAIASDGSVENRQKLLAREVDLAPLQASDIRGDELCVVAPLFYEAVHLLTREEPAAIRSIDDIAGMRVAVGPTGSGSRQAAEFIFASLAWDHESISRVVLPWRDLNKENAPRVAIICGGLGSPLIAELLAQEQWHLVPIPNGIEISLQHPTLRPMTIEPRHYPDGRLPQGGVPTVGTTAFLAARTRAPSALVTAVLEALYLDADRSDGDTNARGDSDVAARAVPSRTIVGLIPRHHAAEWQGLAFHPAARHFFADSDSHGD